MRAMAATDCIGPIKVAMKVRRDAIGLAAEALNNMFNHPGAPDELIEQVHN